MSTAIDKNFLHELYVNQKKSVSLIADELNYSEHKVNYWLAQHGISKRSISDAIYLKHHPDGDPYQFVPPTNSEDERLFGLGLGIYWGEGNKANASAIRIGNTDPALIRVFIEFMERFFCIPREQLRCYLQIFTDINPDEALAFWVRETGLSISQFARPTITVSGSIGTYRVKSQHGVLSVHYGNSKLKKVLLEMLPT